MDTLMLMAFPFFLSIVLNRRMVPIGRKIGLIDVPSGHRRHQFETPLVGGIAMYLAIVVSSWVFYCIDENCLSASMLVAAGMLIVTGALDDRYSLSVNIRLGVQACAALIITQFDSIVFQSFGPLFSDESFHFGVLAVPFSVLITVGCINAINMLDGIDGLAGTITLAIFFTTAVATTIAGTTSQLSVLLCLIGVVAGFLFYNFPFSRTKRVSVFMGDAGSYLLGFLVAIILIKWSQPESNVIRPVTALWLVGIPLYDTVGVIFRRIFMKKSPLKADRNHLHHLLLDAGFGSKQVVLILFALQIAMGLIGVLGLFQGAPDSFMFYTFFSGLCLYSYITLRPHRLVLILQKIHETVFLVKPHHRKVFIGNLPTNKANALDTVRELIADSSLDRASFHLFANESKHNKDKKCFCVVRVIESDFDGVLNYLANKDTNVEHLIFREYHHRKKYSWQSNLVGNERRKARQFELYGNGRRLGQTSLIYSSIRD